MEVRAREFFRRAATWPDLIRDVPELHHPTWHHRDFYWRQDQGRAIDLPDLQRASRKSSGAAPPLQEAPRESNRLRPASARSASRGSCISWATFTSRCIAARASRPSSGRATMAARTSSWRSGRRHIPRESGIPCTPTGTTCSTGLCPGDRASDWACTCSGPRPSSCPSIRGRSSRQSSSRDSSMPGRGNRSSPPRAPIRPSLRRGQEPSADYRNLGIRVALARLALAGYRLALMLRDVGGVVGPGF